MNHWKPKRIGWGVTAVVLLSCALVGRQKASVSALERNTDMQRLLSERALPIPPETGIVPAGTRIQIRLKEAISTEDNSSGDHFTASLDGPLIVDMKLLSPSRNKIIGKLTNVTNVEESGRGKGPASLTMELSILIVNGKEHRLETQPLTFVAQSPKTEDAEVIARDGVPEAALGAFEREGKSPAVGNGVGGGSGAGYVLAAKEVPVVYEPASRFTFTLAAPLKLPVIRKMGAVSAAMPFSSRQEAANMISIRNRRAKYIRTHSVGRTENEN